MGPAAEGPDPFNYTSGRWLRQDALEQQSRYIRFDFDALRRKVVALCPGANSITSYTKIEGGNNRVFVFHTDNAKRIVARLPFPAAGPQRLVTNSEVATIRYLQQKTSIPIPKILEWSDDPSIIGSEYIIMEHAPGVSLLDKWPTMSVDEQLGCLKSILRKLKELAGLDFPGYGSLYFADTPYISRMISFNKEVSIGPHCGTIYWDCCPGQPKYFHDVKPNQGPWHDLIAYCDGLTDNGIARLPPTNPSLQLPRYHGSIQTHRQLLEQGRAVLKALAIDSQVQKAAVPTMFHPDLHKRNIFVSEDDPTVITAILDWQSSSIEPAFLYTDQTPDFAKPVFDTSYEGGKEPKSWACTLTYNAGIMLLLPKLLPAWSMDEALIRPFRYIFRTWDDGAIAFWEQLVKLSRRWEELGFKEPCPFPLPCHDEIVRHQPDSKLFEASLELRDRLSSVLGCTSHGWVPPEQWEAARLTNLQVYQVVLENVQADEQPDDDEPLRSEADVREIWPFDLEY